VFEAADAQLDVLRETVVKHMVNAAALDIPLVVDTRVRVNWDEAHWRSVPERKWLSCLAKPFVTPSR